MPATPTPRSAAEPPPEDRARWTTAEALNYVDGAIDEYGRQLNKIDAAIIGQGLAIGEGTHELASMIHELKRQLVKIEERLTTLEQNG